MSYTTSDLLEDVRFQCRISDTDPDYTVDRILKIATQEMRSTVFPFLITLREDYFVMPIATTLVDGQRSYDISPRSYAGTLKEVKLVHRTVGNVVNLKRYDIDEMNAVVATGTPTGFYITDNQIVLDALPSDTDYDLVQYIYLKPSKFVTTTACGTIAAGTGTSRTITSLAVSSGFVDIISKNDPHNTRAINVTHSGTTSITNCPSSALPGDYVCLEGETCVLGIPNEFSQLIVLATAARIFETVSPTGDLNVVVAKLDRLKATIKEAIVPRIEGSQKTISSIL